MSDGPIITIRVEWPRWTEYVGTQISNYLGSIEDSASRIAGCLEKPTERETNAEREREIGTGAENSLHAAGDGPDQAADENPSARRAGDPGRHEGHAEAERCAECGGSGWTGHVPRRRCLACTPQESEESAAVDRTPQPSAAADTQAQHPNPTDEAPGDITRDEPNPSPGAESLPRYVVVGPRSNGRVWGSYGSAYSYAQSLGGSHMVELYDPDVQNEYTEGRAGR